MTVKTVQTSDHRGQHWLWQDVLPQPPEVRKTAPQIRKHRFHLRPQLIFTILLVVIAFSAGLAIGPYITPYRSIQNMVPMTVTVMTTVEASLMTSVGTSYQTTSATVLQTLTTTTGQSPKWISSSTNVVSYLQAANYVGQSKIVEGKIVRTYASSKGTVFLDFHDPYQGYFQVTIFASVTDAGVSFDGFETDVTVRLHGRIAWIRRNIEADLRDEIYELCDAFARAATRLKSIDQSASVEEVRSFEAALRRIDFGNVANKITWNMLEL